VVDYFAITPFYEKEGCLNEAALAAGRHRSDTQCAPGAAFSACPASLHRHAPDALISGSRGRMRREQRAAKRKP
jgi:hypothetical protein